MRTVNKFIFTGLFFVLAVCAFAQAQDSIVHADTTVITCLLYTSDAADE